MKVVLLGAPGSGKGTQAVGIADTHRIPHISTGDILRFNIAAATPIGVMAKEYIDQGQLIPDSVMIEIVKQRLLESDCERGWILDGFPRTVSQAVELSKFAPPDVVLDIEIPTNKLMARLTGRRVCSACGASYHIDAYQDLTCAKCRAKLIQRADDTPETVARRLDVYVRQTEPLIDFYKKEGILKLINGDNPIEKVAIEVKDVL